MTDLAQRLADLRDLIAKPITLADLPLRDLRAKLIDNGEPLDLSVLGLAGQVPKMRYGHASTTFPGGVNATSSTVLHGLETTPTAVLATFDNVGPWVVVDTSTYTTTQFTWAAITRDGTNPAAATTTGIYWLAIA